MSKYELIYNENLRSLAISMRITPQDRYEDDVNLGIFDTDMTIPQIKIRIDELPEPTGLRTTIYGSEANLTTFYLYIERRRGFRRENAQTIIDQL